MIFSVNMAPPASPTESVDMNASLRTRRSRIEPQQAKDLSPFLRASQVTDISLYWAPVTEFPVPLNQREWMREFLNRLAAHLKEKDDLREEWFLQFKALYPNLIDRFVEHASEYVPVTGLGCVPGAMPVALPDFESVKKEVEKASKKGSPVEVQQWMPDHVHWFAAKQSQKQRQDFFGYGGMFELYMQPNTKAARTLPKLPRFMTTHEAYTPDLERQFAMLNSLQDNFLPKSKELFGPAFRQDPSYRGLPFIVPLLSSRSFLDSTPEQRETWFSLFHAYFIESKQDNGVLFASSNSAFDEDLISILEGMQRDGFSYRS